jgi:hypothetical protein
MRRSALVALLVVGALLVPLGVFASHQFVDVPNSHTFHNAIDWMKDNNITVGCNPPTNNRYCPDDPVDRGQMAAFMKRLAENQVVDAATLDGQDSVAYTTEINGVACEASCPDGAGLTIIPVLSLNVDAPAAGVLHVSFSHQNDAGNTNDFVQDWIAIDQASNSGCGGWFFVPTASTPGSYVISFYDGTINAGTNSGSVAVALSAGDHNVTLCSLSTEAFISNQGSLSTIWSASGAGGAIAGTTDISDAERAQLQGSLGEDVPNLD